MIDEGRKFIEVQAGHITWRYYGYAHVKGARCMGEGEWTQTIAGREERVNGINIPGDIFHKVIEELES